ncbi:hypothetical protein TWF281_007078 [Arthrobotrys megalospora]
MSDGEITFSVGEEVLITQDNDEIITGTIAGEVVENSEGKFYPVTINGEEPPQQISIDKIMRNVGMSNRMASMNVYAGR